MDKYIYKGKLERVVDGDTIDALIDVGFDIWVKKRIRYKGIDTWESRTRNLEEKKLGKRKTNFRLKDWGISRQRYWGCPIPIAYDENNNVVKVPEKELPVELPEDIDLNTNGNPLDSQEEWKKIEINGKKCRRETDTLDTFVDSSWYFLRFCSAQNLNEPFDKSELDYWMPVDQYIGGVEHAILHLLYSRFFWKQLTLKIKILK